jgi:hypothetical protein
VTATAIRIDIDTPPHLARNQFAKIRLGDPLSKADFAPLRRAVCTRV